MLKRLLAAAATLLCSLAVVTFVALLGSMTHADAVRYSEWVDVAQVTEPVPGQLYAISENGIVEGQLCPLTKDDFTIRKDKLSGRRFINRLGEAVPSALWLARHYLPGDQADGQVFEIDYHVEWRSLEREYAPLSALSTGIKRILRPRPMELIRKQAPATELAEAHRLEGCAETILEALADGRNVCQLSQVIKEPAGRILAVRFATRCLALDPDSDPRSLPTLHIRSFWTNIKLGLGLVDQELLPSSSSVLAGSASD